MSFEAIAAVRKLHEHTQVVPREQLILYVLAGYADMNWESWPSQGRIGDETGYSRQTVNKILGNLEAKGLVKSDQRMRKDGGQSSKLYKLVLPTVIVADPESIELSTGLHPLSTRGDRGLSTRGDTKVSIERKTKDLPPYPPKGGLWITPRKAKNQRRSNSRLLGNRLSTCRKAEDESGKHRIENHSAGRRGTSQGVIGRTSTTRTTAWYGARRCQMALGDAPRSMRWRPKYSQISPPVTDGTR